MRRLIVISSAVGFLVPIFWGILGFILFSAPQSRFTDLYWATVYVTCPAWFNPGLWGSIIMPFANAVLYAGIAYFLVTTMRTMAKTNKL